MKPRSSQGVSRPIPSPPAALETALWFLLAAALFWWTKRSHLADGWMEDLPVYAHAVQNWMAGHNPYNASMAPLYFLYPPVFLLGAASLAVVVPAHWGPLLYIVATTVALCAIPVLLARYFLRQSWLPAGFALLLFLASPRFTGVMALQTMNIASIFYCLAFAAAVPGLRRNRWNWFYVAVFLAAIVKITFLSLLLLPVLVGYRQFWRSFACASAVVASNAAELLTMPSLYRGYEWSLHQGIVGSRAYGYGIYGILGSHLLQRPGLESLPMAASLLASLAVTGILLRLRWQLSKARRSGQDLASNGNWLALVILGAILVNPRLMQYDMDVALLVAYVLWINALRTTRVRMWMLAWFLPSMAVPLWIHDPHLHGVFTTGLVLASFGLGSWHIWRSAKSDEMGAQLLQGVAAGSTLQWDNARAG